MHTSKLIEKNHVSSLHKLTLLDGVLFYGAILFLCVCIASITLIKVPFTLYIGFFCIGTLYLGINALFVNKSIWILAMSHFLLLVGSFLFWNQLLEEMDQILYATKMPIEINFILSLIVIFFMMWLFTFLVLWPKPWIFTVGILLFLCIFAVTGYSFPGYWIPLLLGFMILIWYKPLFQKRSLNWVIPLGLIGVGCAFGWILTLAIESPANQMATQIEETINHAIQKEEIDSHHANSGVIWRGNNYPDDALLFTIESDEPIESPLYFRSFTGSSYQDGQWSYNNENRLESLVQSAYSSYISPYQINNNLTSLQMTMADRSDSFPKQIKIQSDTIKYKNLLPYYSLDSYIKNDTLYVTGYLDLNQKELISEEEYSQEQLYFNAAYEEAIHFAYTNVNTKNLPKLKQLVNDNPKTDRDAVTAMIVRLLQTYTTYTRTPGYMSQNQDVVESFLFDQQQGYCIHYASVATLLYQMYNIPARYVSGYVVYPDDFQEENGNYSASVPEDHAHAWVELYFEGVGWTPVEMTPDSNGQIHATYPGLSQEELDDLIKNDTSNFSILNQNRFIGSRDWNQRKPFFILIILILFLVLIIFFSIRYLHFQKAVRLWKAKDYITSIIRTLKIVPGLEEIRFTQKDFVNQIHVALPEIQTEAIQQLQDLANQAYFSSHAVSKNNLIQLHSLYTKAIEKKLSKPKLLYYRYIRCLII